MISSRESKVKVKIIDDTKDQYRIRLESMDGLEIATVHVDEENNSVKLTNNDREIGGGNTPEPEPGIDEEILCEENVEPAKFATVVASDGLAQEPEDYMFIFEIVSRKKYFDIMRDASSPDDITKFYNLFYETLKPRYVIALSEVPEEMREELFSGEDIPLYALFEELGLGEYVYSIEEVLSEASDEFKDFYTRVLKALKQVYFKMPNAWNNDYDIYFSDIDVSKNFVEEDTEDITYDEIAFFPGPIPNDNREAKYVDPDFCVLDFINSGIDGSGDTPEPQEVDKYYIIDIRSIDSDPTGQEVNIVLNGELVGYPQVTEIDDEPEIVGFNFINKQFMAKVGDEISFIRTDCQEEWHYAYNASEAGILDEQGDPDVYGGTLVGDGGHIVISFGKTQE